MGRIIYDFNVGDKVSWFGNKSKTTVLTGEIKQLNIKLDSLFVRHLYDGDYFLKEIHISEVINHEPCQENNKKIIKVGDTFFYTIKDNKVNLLLEVLGFDTESDLLNVKVSIGRYFTFIRHSESFIKNTCTPVEDYNIPWWLEKHINDDEVMYVRRNGFLNKQELHESTKDLKFDEINKPKHYNSGKYETKEVIKDILSNYKDSSPYTQYCVGNLLKYISRGPLKENLLKDLKKGMFYLEESIKEIESESDE